MKLKPWESEHQLDASRVQRILAAQFPDHAGAHAHRIGQGWDVEVWRTGELVWRFPRRAIGAELLQTEIRVLPELAPRLPLPTPNPLYVGEPSDDFEWPFYGHRFLPGRGLEQLAPSLEQRGPVGAAIGRFLKALHGIDAGEAAAMGIPADTFRGDMHRQQEVTLPRIELIDTPRFASLIPGLRRALESHPEDATGARCAIHGDVYARHLLLNEDAKLAAVIDWGDVCIGDPAGDISIAYTLLAPEQRPAFFDAYGEVDAATRARARYVGMCRYGVALLGYALDIGDEPLIAEAGRALANSLA